MRSRKNRRKQSISSRRKPPKNTRRERETRAEAIPKMRWVVNTLSQRAGGDIQIPKRNADTHELVGGMQRNAGNPDTHELVGIQGIATPTKQRPRTIFFRSVLDTAGRFGTFVHYCRCGHSLGRERSPLFQDSR